MSRKEENDTVRSPGDELALLRALHVLREDRSPERDLWPEIAAALPRRRVAGSLRRPRWGWMALAASLLLATVWVLPKIGAFGDGQMSADTERETLANSMQLQARSMTIEYQAALAELGGVDIPTPLRATVDELDRSARDIRFALQTDPDASFLLYRLQDVYSRRLQLTLMASQA